MAEVSEPLNEAVDRFSQPNQATDWIGDRIAPKYPATDRIARGRKSGRPEDEKKEHELFGEDGFERMAARVAQLEQRMGIHDLDQFTPR
jgi:hypothetical protein